MIIYSNAAAKQLIAKDKLNHPEGSLPSRTIFIKRMLNANPAPVPGDVRESWSVSASSNVCTLAYTITIYAFVDSPLFVPTMLTTSSSATKCPIPTL